MKHLKKITFFLMLALLLPATATAIDFEVDGIYYNRTSNNTVEVTYKDVINSSYQDTIVIPSVVNYNNVYYMVTAIGDSAFHGSTIQAVTIPETITSIGRDAFTGIEYILKVTCLPLTPPEMEGAFDHHDHIFPFALFYPEESIFYSNANLTVLFVSTSAYQSYKNANEYLRVFSWIFCYDGEKTTTPSCTVNYERSLDRYTAVQMTFTPNEESIIYHHVDYEWGSSNFFNYWEEGNTIGVGTPEFSCQKRWINDISGFAVAEGKLPSDLVHLYDYEDDDFRNYLLSPYYMYDQMGVEDENQDIFLNYSGILYSKHNNYLSISGGLYQDPCGHNDYIWQRSVDYSGDIIIPSTIDNYTVSSIGYQAFAGCYNLSSLKLPNTIGEIRSEAFNGVHLKRFYFPVSACWYDEICEADTVFLTGNGNLSSPPFNNNVKVLHIGSGVTGIEGMAGYDGGDELYLNELNPEVIYSYASIPPVCNECSFSGYDAELHVPAASLASYFTAPYWQYFTNIVGDAVAINDFSFIEDSIEVLDDSQTTLNTVIIPANACPNTIYWKSSDNTVATVENGVVSALKNGECDIYALCQDKCAVCHLFISDVLTSSVSLSQDTAKMEIGNQLKLIASVIPNGDYNKPINWSSTNTTVATVIDGTINALSSGECDIVASCCGKKAICHVIVTEVMPTAIIMSNESVDIELGDQITLTATLQPDNVTNKTILWQSSNNEVARVDSYGSVTAIKVGDCDIIASCGSIHAACHINVVAKLAYISLDHHEASVLPNHIITLTPTVFPVTTELVVTSSNPSVAAARMANGKVQVVGIKEGKATITINSADGYTEPDSCLVEVYTERGDVNCDGYVNIADVTMLIDILLGAENMYYSAENADVNNDGNLSIGDATTLVDYLLGGTPLPNDNVEEVTVNGVTFQMIKVKGGTFTMGATAGQGTAAYDDELPAHEVTLSDFIIGQTEVTQELWQAVMGSNPSQYQGDLSHPVEKVSWDDCQAFIAKLNQMTGLTFRLPTEAEWEFAARGGNKSHDYRYAGSDYLDSVAWALSNIPSQQAGNPGYGTQPVAQKQPNELGLYDMSGNVYEWVNDWYDVYSADAQINPTGPGPDEGCHYRVNRGGAWNRAARSCRVTLRNYAAPSSAYSNIGLRLVLDNTGAYNVNGVMFKMVKVDGGTFTMGATPEQGTSAPDSEKPAHQVTLSGFSIGQTEVTQALWLAVMGSNPSHYSGDSNRPVECISWNDCQTFIAKLNQMTGLQFRLPTEAEWEFAARGGNMSQGYIYAGSNNVDDVAWYKGNIPSQTSGTEGYGTQPVAQKQPNELGLYDMSGNVWEWCQDWYGNYTSDAQTNPTGPATGSTRVVRGGSWYNSYATNCRIPRRNGCQTTDADTYLGLRLAL